MITRRRLLGSAGLGAVVLCVGSWAVKSSAAPAGPKPTVGHPMDMDHGSSGTKDDDPKDKKGRRWKLIKKQTDDEYMLMIDDKMPDHHLFMGNKKQGYYSHALGFGQRYKNPAELRKALIEAHDLDLFAV